MKRPDNISLENWNELSLSEKRERLLPKELQEENLIKAGFFDWNKYDLDKLADYLEEKWRFMSSGEAHAIMEMVRFYRKNKDNV